MSVSHFGGLVRKEVQKNKKKKYFLSTNISKKRYTDYRRIRQRMKGKRYFLIET